MKFAVASIRPFAVPAIVRIIAWQALILALASCGSSSEKAKVRLAVDAYEKAVNSGGKDEVLLSDLRWKINNVGESEAQKALLGCEEALRVYVAEHEAPKLTFAGHQAEQGAIVLPSSETLGGINAETPEADPRPLIECRASTLPRFTR